MSKANLQRKVMDEFSGGLEIEHTPVLVGEVLEYLRCRPGRIFVDGTLGQGGHALAILERIQPDGLLIGLDRDRESLERSRIRLAAYKVNIRFYHENFKNLPLVLNNLQLRNLDGICLDLGVSAFQLLSEERGFSFQSDAMLDMRQDRSQRLTAADLVNNLSEEKLADIIYRYGEERLSRRIAAAIVAERKATAIMRCSQLAGIISRVLKGRGRQHIHPATRTFQALRIEVNQELEGLDTFFSEALPYLKREGRIVVIAFHSLEDRIVKTAFRRLAGQCVCDHTPDLCICPRKPLARILTCRPVTAGPAELAANPRSRSARLRVLERL